MQHSSKLALLLAVISISARAAGVENQRPYPGISYHSETHTDPPMRLFVAEIDLTDPRAHVRVAPGGADPDGPGKWQTTLMRPTVVAAREGFDLVVNGDFFLARNTKDAEGKKSGYRDNIWASVEGPAVTDGKIWSQSVSNRPCLVVHKDRSVDFETLNHPGADDEEVIAGNVMLVEKGKALQHKNKTRNPRTAVGVDDSGRKLTILVVDGRKPGVSVGMSYDELAAEMIRLGCRRALNLDGGGSSVMALRDPATGKMQILNVPSDGHERPVANTLGVTIDPAKGP